MFDPLVNELSQRYGLGDRGRELFGLLMGYIHNDRRGGFGGFVENFREQGHGDLLSSWFGDPVSRRSIGPAEVGTVFGQGLLNDWGSRLGVSRATLAAAIAGVLPRLVAELTPGGRMPGGLAPVAPYEWPSRDPETTADDGAGRADDAFPAQDARRSDPPARDAGDLADETTLREGSFSARPGVDGLIAPLPEHAEPGRPVFESHPPMPVPLPLGEVVPGELVRPTGTADDRSQGLRRESIAANTAASPLRTPVSARREPQFDRTPADAGERRIADMASAINDPGSTATTRESDGMADLDFRRPTAQRARPRSGGFGWLLWIVLVLAILAVAGWYAWQQGLLDPYIARYNLALPTSGAPDTR